MREMRAMPCPACGYMMTAFDKSCPRCRGRGLPPRALPVTARPLPPPPAGAEYAPPPQSQPPPQQPPPPYAQTPSTVVYVQVQAPAVAARPAGRWPAWARVAAGLAVLVLFCIFSSVSDFVAQDDAAKRGYGERLAQISGGSYAQWRANADGFTYRVERLGADPSRVVIVGDDHGRSVRVGVVLVQRTGPWQWQPTDISLDPPPYPDYPGVAGTPDTP